MIHIVINEHAKKGRKTQTDKLRELLTKKKAAFTIHRTTQPGDATDFVRKICDSGEKADIWVVGGDGTINEAVNGLRIPSQVTLSVLPGGSGNDYVKGLGLPGDLIDCAKKLLGTTETRGYDVGETETFEERGTVRFAGSCGIGYDAKVCHEVDNSALKKVLNKLHLGKLAYFIVALKQVFANPRFNATVIIDGESRTYSDVIFLCFMNNRYEGGGLKMAPDANPCDGKLSVVMAHGIRPLRVLTLLPKLMRGTHVKHRNVDVISCREIEVITNQKQYLHTDGDVQCQTRHVRVSCLPEQIRMPACGTQYEGRPKTAQP
ncbi:MAG: diacylglycerol kinase family lipid kinase [Lachnospiraceae bacterium]|nr:diacylglycerol kinase family lipid kinase [Lachnospiraceae bacterium]